MIFNTSNTPRGYFEEYNGRSWVKTSLDYVLDQINTLPDPADAYDRLIKAGLQGGANNLRTRNPIRFSPQ